MPRRLIIASITALLGAAVFAPISMAQRRGFGFGRGVNVSFNGRPHAHSFGPGAIFLGDPFYADYPVAPLTIPPQYLVVQPTTTIDTAPEAKSEPLMIELQGNRYVRFGGRQQPAERGTNSPPDYVGAAAAATDLSRRSSRTSARVCDRRRHSLRKRRLLAERPLDEKHRTLRTEHRGDSASKSRQRRKISAALRSERSHHPALTFVSLGPETATSAGSQNTPPCDIISIIRLSLNSCKYNRLPQ